MRATTSAPCARSMPVIHVTSWTVWRASASSRSAFVTRFAVSNFQGFGDALGLRAGETFGFEFLDDPVGVDHERLHRSSVYHATSRLQRKDRVMGASRAATALSCFAPSRRRRLGLRRSS